MTWQPIETAPRDYSKMLAWNGREVLFVVRGENGHCIEAASGNPGFAGDGHGDPLFPEPEPTHWMPLPNPPAEQSAAA